MPGRMKKKGPGNAEGRTADSVRMPGDERHGIWFHGGAGCVITVARNVARTVPLRRKLRLRESGADRAQSLYTEAGAPFLTA
jgi:hypothetical protein